MADQLKNEANECFKSKCEEKKCKKVDFDFVRKSSLLYHMHANVCACVPLKFYIILAHINGEITS